MSLINKMLRDLDARHAPAGPAALPDEVRPLPEKTVPPRIGRGVWILAGVAGVAIVALQTTAWWIPPLISANLISADMVPRGLLPAPAIVAHAPAPAPVVQAPTTVVLQMPPPEQMLPLPALPDTPAPAAGTPPSGAPSAAPSATPPAAAPGREPAPPPLADSRSGGLKIDNTLPEVTSQSAASLAAARPKQLAATAKSGRAGVSASAKIDKQQAMASPHDRAEAEYRKGVATFRQGHAHEAIVQLRAALQEDARHLAARQTLLSLLAEQKQWDEVQSLLREGLDLMPAQIAWAMALARIQVEGGNAMGAWDTLQKYMAHGEKNADYQGFAGVLLQRLQKPREAAQHYLAAVQIKPFEGRWWLGLGLAYEADGRSAEARDAFQHARGASGLTPEMAAVIDKKLR